MSHSSSSVTGTPVEDHRNRTCYCGLPVREYTSSKPPSNGLRFIRCPKKKGEQCLFFEWVDTVVCMRCADTISRLEARVREHENTIGALEARIVDLLVSERLMQLKAQEQESCQSELYAKVAHYGDRVRCVELKVLYYRKWMKLAYIVAFGLFVALLFLNMVHYQEVASSSFLKLGPKEYSVLSHHS